MPPIGGARCSCSEDGNMRAEVTADRLQMADNGWPVIPVSGKAPSIPEWQRFCLELPTEHRIESWGRAAARSTGIACGKYVVAIDIDIKSDADLAGEVELIAFEVFGPTPFKRIGL